MKTKNMTNQQLANFHKRNIYLYLLKDGNKITSFFEYKPGDIYGGIHPNNEVVKLIETFVPIKQ